MLPFEEIEKKVGSRYALTVLAGKRARQLRDGSPQLVNSDSNNPILIALQEILEGKIVPDNLDYTAEEPTPKAAKNGRSSPPVETRLADVSGAGAAGVELSGTADTTGAPVDASTLEVADEAADVVTESDEEPPAPVVAEAVEPEDTADEAEAAVAEDASGEDAAGDAVEAIEES